MADLFLAFRPDIEKMESQMLAPYACHSYASRGREYEEEPDPQRTAYQRDRDRIIHCSSFRRLKGKTQVFIAHHGDHFRNRLTHTMEVAQLARDFSRNLRLNEDLSEAIALSHDLGHTPFGHAGQQAMRELLHRFGFSFEHNLQSRRIVEKLEKKSPLFPGINLSWEVRDGLLKHRKADYESSKELRTANGSLEAQIVDISDQIAYQNHDIDDGLRAEIVHLSELERLDIWKRASANIRWAQPEKLKIQAIISQLIKIMADDLLQETSRRLLALSPKNEDDIRHAKKPIASLSEIIEAENDALRHFLYSKFYRQPTVSKQSEHGQQIIKKIFFFLLDKKNMLPNDFQMMIEKGENPIIVLKDFIAGMTDEYALQFVKEHIEK